MVGAGKRRRRNGKNIQEKENVSDPRNDTVTNNDVPLDQYDGPSGPPGDRGRPQSQVGSPTPMSPRSPARIASPTAQRADPALDRPQRITDMCRNVDLSPELFRLDGLFMKEVPLPSRPGFNTTGKEVLLAVNAYPITQFPTKSIYQYDVVIGTGAEKRIVNQKVWESKTRKEKLGSDFIFDGSKLAWSMKKLTKDANFSVDLDEEQGRQGRSGTEHSNVFRLVVRHTKVVNLAVVQEVLRGNKSMHQDALEGLNFLDHLLRETPSRRFMAIKRSFFSEDNPKASVGGGVFAYKGIYQAIRMVQPGTLSVNVDVSNSCFFALFSLIGIALEVLELRDVQHLMANTKPESDGFGGRKTSAKFDQLRRLKKLIVRAKYRGCPCPEKEWQIKEFIPYNAKEFKLDMKNPATGTSKEVTIFEYFKSKYNVNLDYWQLPLVKMTKKNVVYPMELLGLYKAQKYPFKLNDLQTSSMIKFAVTRPSERMQAITNCKKNLEHDTDPILKEYGLKIGNEMAKTKARLLPNPEIQFGGNQRVNPGTSGRWDLRGKKFFTKNKQPLISWGVGYFQGRNRMDPKQVEAFCDALVRAYKGHGGDVTTSRPVVMEVANDPAKAVFDLFHATGNKFNKRPELLIFVVADRNSFHYTRIKKSCDCRFGVVSQVLQGAQVAKCNGQYISNVLMKINAKLGGTTARAHSKLGLPPKTIIVGADVSHSSPGSQAPSMAAMTVSMDEFGGRYLAGCETNGEHVEIISNANIKQILSPLFREWVMTIGGGSCPRNLMYFRDGVSEGQFQHVLQEEIPFMKEILKEINQGNEWLGKVTVIIASKRHHIRAFPRPGDKMSADKNGNPLPGTLVERDVTSPLNWDFFLWSHTALQGTSRPVHYHVLHDTIGCKPNVLQNMIYEHCYQYMRSTTSVSLFPAVYYAHLASNRARAHENVPASSGPQSGPGVRQNQPPPQEPKKTEAAQLLPMPEQDRLAFKMWYI